MADQIKSTSNWPDLALAIYDRLNERNAEISYDFKDMHVSVPSDTEDHSKVAEWTLNGEIKIRARNLG